MLAYIRSGIAAGLLITIGGTVFLSCDNRYLGAVFFSVALLCICYKGYALFTGKIGLMAQSHTKDDWQALFFGLLGNILGTAFGGAAIIFSGLPASEAAKALVASKLLQAGLETFIRAAFCGILMYMAVSIYREKTTVLGIVFCIPVFILCGFEHSVADMFYVAAADSFSWQIAGFLALVLLGNAAGALLMPLLQGGVLHDSNKS